MLSVLPIPITSIIETFGAQLDDSRDKRCMSDIGCKASEPKSAVQKVRSRPINKKGQELVCLMVLENMHFLITSFDGEDIVAKLHVMPHLFIVDIKN